MKITKFVHSCVLVQDGDKAVLFDPGVFSWNSGLVDVDALPELDAIVVTHLHGDHMAEPFVRALAQRFPDVQWVAPSDALQELKKLGVDKVTNQSIGDLEVIEVDHAPVIPFGVQQCKNLVVHWNGKVTHPGDTHEIPETKDVLLLPVQAPWGTTVRAIQLPGELKPKVVLPIHDWMWNEDWRQDVYSRFDQVLGESQISFIRPVDGQLVEVEV